MRNVFQKTAVLVGLVFTLASTPAIYAQEAPHSAAPQQGTATAAARLRIRIVISRSDETEAARKAGKGGLISSLPYEIRVNADNRNASLRLSEKVPVLNNNAFSYMDIGTNIDCSATSSGDRFIVQLTIQDTSPVGSLSMAGSPPQAEPRSQPTGPGSPPILRNFSITNTISLKNGEPVQFVAATDKASHETTKVEVTLSVEN